MMMGLASPISISVANETTFLASKGKPELKIGVEVLSYLMKSSVVIHSGVFSVLSAHG